jgi:hypothetical protein
VPAVTTTFHGHVGIVIIMQTLTTPGPFCRYCGLGVFRTMTSRGLVGPAVDVHHPITVLINLANAAQVVRLAAPQPNPYGASQHPMDPGPSILRRPGTWVGVAVSAVLLTLFIAVAIASNG